MRNRNQIQYMLAMLLLIVGLLAVPTIAQEQARELTTKLTAHKADTIKRLQQQLTQIRNEMKTVYGAEMRALGRKAAYLKKEIQNYQAMEMKYYVPELPDDLPLGSFGMLPRGGGGAPSVVRIIDDDEFVGEFTPDGPSIDEQYRSLENVVRGTPQAGTVRGFAAMVDSTRALDRANALRGHVWIKGVSTSSANLGTKASQLPFRNSLWRYYYEVTGTKDWDGMNIPVLEAFPFPISGKGK